MVDVNVRMVAKHRTGWSTAWAVIPAGAPRGRLERGRDSCTGDAATAPEFILPTSVAM
jgi:hypothetical protein